jgi:GR25 family glycosyltransferase involved in LPS biosynthesis
MIDKIFVLHHKDFIKRGLLIEKRLKEENIEFDWVTDFEPENIKDIYNNIDYINYSDIDIIHPYGIYKNKSIRISIGSLSLILKHLWCLEEQIKNNYENILILEDDVEIPKNFKNYLENNVRDFLELKEQENTTILMLGISHDYRTKNYTPGKFAHYSPNQKTRCTHAYISNIEASKKLVKNFKPFNLPIDFKLNEIIQLEDIKVAWSEPALYQRPV